MSLEMPIVQRAQLNVYKIYSIALSLNVKHSVSDNDTLKLQLVNALMHWQKNEEKLYFRSEFFV